MFVRCANAQNNNKSRTLSPVYKVATSPPLKVSRVLAVVGCSGRLFHSLMLEGKKECWFASNLQNEIRIPRWWPLVLRFVGLKNEEEGIWMR